LHANGDATGAEISRSLVAFARAHKRIQFAEWTMVSGLLLEDGRVVGADLASAGRDALHAQPRRVSARATLIAAGGAGQVYSDTTNPAVATGDGIALAFEAGAALADMEFYQFHPTALALPGVPRFLLSEALRGEGATLRNDRGERFMERYHPLLELAPRDVVARAIAREGMAAEGAWQLREVYLDMRHVRDVDLHQRFPGISAFLARHGLDLSRDLIPVRPAAHYLMGGIRTDLDGRSSLAGLYAAGEAACTGVHGANRLASNSLLEGLVFGARAAQAMLADDLPLAANQSMPSMSATLESPTKQTVVLSRPGDKDKDVARMGHPAPLSQTEKARVEELIARLRADMWKCAGLLRDESTLREGLAAQAACAAELSQLSGTGRRLLEARALATVARVILVSALGRTESRGAHFRNDFPRRDDLNFQKHSVLRKEADAMRKDAGVEFESW
jgi:L-aspartate oxidase